MVQEITYSDFDEKVMHGAGTILLVFGAEWCGHCRSLSPVLEQLAHERNDVTIYHADVDSQAALAERFSVMGVPALFVIKNGNIISRVTGAQPKHAIEALLG